MKSSLTIAAVLIALFSGTAFADEGHVSGDTLAAMGLPGMVVVSDAEGLQIRGEGFAFAQSISASALPGTFTSNSAIALGFNHADAATGATSELELDVLTGIPLPVLSLQVRSRVGSSGFAVANSD